MKNIKAIILMLLTSVICFTSFTVYAETNTLKAGILDDYSFDGNSINEYAEDSMNTILDTTASTNFIANEINFDDTTFNKGISDHVRYNSPLMLVSLGNELDILSFVICIGKYACPVVRF